MIKKDVAILIPIYKDSLDLLERVSLNRCFSLWGKSHDIFFVKPESLNIDNIRSEFGPCEVASFAGNYFTDLSAYNRLLYSAEFYGRFLDYKYIFIYQTDGYAFRDELDEWCAKDYDYIGAPWIPKDSYTRLYNRAFVSVRRAINKSLGKPDRSQQYYEVGNGGVCLRKTEVFHRIATTDIANIERYISNLGKSSMYNEDIYWSLAPKPSGQLTKPGYKEALRFSFDMNPSVCYRLNNNQLPFCCHSFSKPRFWKFWQQHISPMLSWPNGHNQAVSNNLQNS
ncbi:MAG: hypothetical protein A2X18_11155 [Bacteroidetes bacterium GWF2_40_14]|nr:MAG: hypothetical protein A2X18_11155 [Bacteroidetes bacterium GWF2_40_14]